MSDPSAGAGRRVIDITSAVLWTGGHPTGIVRAHRELARWAEDHLPDAIFAVYDAGTKRHMRVADSYVASLIGGDIRPDTWSLLPRREPWHSRRLGIAGVVGRLFRLRRLALQWLEQVRLETRRPAVAAWADRVQRRMMTGTDLPQMVGADGARRPFPRADRIYAGPVRFGPGDVLVCTGHGWVDTDIADILMQRARSGHALALLCYDIIALTAPQLFPPWDASRFAAYWNRAFPAADLVVFNSTAVARDAGAYAAGLDVGIRATAVAPLGSDPAAMAQVPESVLPDGLSENRYALFVSTLEPRKGHAFLLDVWRRLLADGVPQAAGFKLVFVGRWGWNMDALRTSVEGDPRLADTLLILPDAPDATLDLLYRSSAFCLFPSLYEGYGLPVVEALSRGKAVLVSDGGALPEVVGEFSPVLPARDAAVWFATLKAWIEQPALRAPYEAAIRARYHSPTWSEAAAQFFGLIDSAFGPAAAAPIDARGDRPARGV